MSSPGTRLLPDVSAWRPQNLQLIAFPISPAVSQDQTWWQELTGGEPEDFVSSKKKHQREDKGTFQGTALSLSIDLLRITWTATAPSELQEIPEDFLTVGAFLEKRDWFVQLMSQWLSASCPPIYRLAFACKLLQRANDHAAGYRLLGNYLPGVSIDPESSDFLYRINRKRPSTSGIPNLRINRLSIWSVVKYSISIQAQVGTSGPVVPTPTSSENVYACSLDLDINTVPEFREELHHENLPRLLEELVNLGTEIATQGDIP